MLAELAVHYERHIKLEAECIIAIAVETLDSKSPLDVGREIRTRRWDDRAGRGNKHHRRARLVWARRGKPRGMVTERLEAARSDASAW